MTDAELLERRAAQGEAGDARPAAGEVPIDDADGPARAEPSDGGDRPFEAERTAAAIVRDGTEETPRRGGAFWQVASFFLVWAGVALALAAIALTILTPGGAAGVGLVLGFGLVSILALFIAGGALRLFSPVLLTGAMLRRASGKAPAEAAQLAGADMLAALDLAEKVLDGDDDARLVTRRDGVVVFANAAYHKISADAGVTGPAGLPPRIDRLFAQQGDEATKLFRLCRAAKSAAPAEETIYQLMGLEGGGQRRRFEVTVRPMPGAEEYVSWRLRELPLDEEETDALAAAYADFLHPVFALEKSGQIAWANAAMRDRLGASRGSLRHIDDVVLGESADVVRALWRVDRASVEARVRQRFGDPVDATFKAFRRGGLGEGFVCVALAVEEAAEEEETVAVSGDMGEAPFGVAVIEGEIGRDARVAEANKAFTDVFGGKKKNAPLSKCLSPAALEELAAEIRRKASAGGAPRPVEAIVGEGAGARCHAIFARPVKRRRGSYGVRRTLLYSVDVTARKRMEEDYAQDQKLKAIGHLAGQVAHDFNNLLQVVMGNCEHLMLRHPVGDPTYQELVQIRENAQRGANMTKQLLAYSRKQTLTRKVQSITDILIDFSRFLDRAVGEKVKLSIVNGRGLPPVKVDRNQIETAIMNLAVNARDAMASEGGKLTISTRLATA